MRWRRGCGLISLSVVVLIAAPSAAQEPPPLPVVRITAVSPAIARFRCGNIDADLTPGEVVLERSGDPGTGLDVTVEVTEIDFTRPTEVRFGPGESTASVGIGSGSIVPRGPVVVTLVDGTEYDLGEPATATVLVDDSGVERGCPPYEPPLPPEPRVVDPTFAG